MRLLQVLVFDFGIILHLKLMNDSRPDQDPHRDRYQISKQSRRRNSTTIRHIRLRKLILNPECPKS
jgi:hypothetical protein